MYEDIFIFNSVYKLPEFKIVFNCLSVVAENALLDISKHQKKQRFSVLMITGNFNVMMSSRLRKYKR